MAAKKVGTLIKEARTREGFTQAQLAAKVHGLTAADISKAERGEKELTQEQLKAVAQALGITQKSLLDAAKGASAKPAAKKPAANKPAASKPASSSSSTGVKLTNDEKKLINLYRKADDDTKKAAAQLLEKGLEETGNLLTNLLGGAQGGNSGNSGSGAGGLIGSLLGGGGNSGSGAGNLIGSLLGGGGNNNQSSSGNAGASLLGALLGGGGNSGSNNAGANVLGSLLGGVLGKREMPEDGGEKE